MGGGGVGGLHTLVFANGQCFLEMRLNTPGNVCAVQWRLISTVEAVQYSGGLTSVLWRLCSTVEG